MVERPEPEKTTGYPHRLLPKTCVFIFLYDIGHLLQENRKEYRLLIEFVQRSLKP